MAAETPKAEFIGILERISRRRKEGLASEDFNPLEYHFRTIATREFCRIQEKKLKTIEVETGRAKGKVTQLVKNTAFSPRLEDDAKDDIDASLSIMLQHIVSNPAEEAISAEIWADDVRRLWRERA